MKYFIFSIIISLSISSRARELSQPVIKNAFSDTALLNQNIQLLKENKSNLEIQIKLKEENENLKEINRKLKEENKKKIVKDSITLRKAEIKTLKDQLDSTEKKLSNEINKAKSSDSTKNNTIESLTKDKNKLNTDKNNLNKEKSDVINTLKKKYEPSLDSLAGNIDEITLITEKQILETLQQKDLIDKIKLLLKYQEGKNILNQKFNQSTIDKYLNQWPNIAEADFKKLFAQKENIKLYSENNKKLIELVKKGMEINKVEEKTANTRAAQKLNTMSEILSMYSGEIEYKQYPYLDLVISEFLRDVYNSGSPKEDLESLRSKL